LVNLDSTIGSEQSKTRPVLVFCNEDINSVLTVLTGIPITSFKEGRKIYINEVFISTKVSGLKRYSILLCYQIRTIDKKRLIKEIGKIKNEGTAVTKPDPVLPPFGKHASMRNSVIISDKI